jgi:hypothetical protein
MKYLKITVFLLVCLLSLSVQAQKEYEEMLVDVVYLQKGAIMGHIQHVDKQSGVLTIKDLTGRVFVLQSGEYRFYIEDQLYRKRKKGEVLIHPRKDHGPLFYAELGMNYANVNHNFNPDAFFINAPNSYGMLASMLRVGYGKVMNIRNEISGFAQFASTNGDGSMFGFGARYARTYNRVATNLITSIPVELSFSRYQLPVSYDIHDTIFDGNGGWQYPNFANSESHINTIGLSVGHSIGKALRNKKAILWEVRFFQNLSLSHQNQPVEGKTAMSQYGINGIQSTIRFSW